jgi:ubiquinone biosynthesis protein
LILLQKSMVIVEGVARDLDPTLNVWIAAEPVAKEWMESNLSPLGRLREAGRGVETIGDVLMKTPALLQNLAQAVNGFSQMANAGLRLDDETVNKIASRSRRSRAADIAVWIAAVSLAIIMIKMLSVL